MLFGELLIMTRTDIEQEYFDWMYHLVCDGRYTDSNSHKKLLTYLHDTEFIYSIPKDANRAEDGEDLRYRFAYEMYDHDSRDYVIDCLSRPCSMLEMMIALSIKCESIMDDPSIGDRTGQWFWGMIVNLGLSGMYDRVFDLSRAENVIDRFLNRDYEPDGKGGLFRVRHCDHDIRDEEIWTQMLWFLDSIV